MEESWVSKRLQEAEATEKLLKENKDAVVDRIEHSPGEIYYRVIIDGYVIALCPDEVTAQMCYFALTTSKDMIKRIAKQLAEERNEQRR